MTESEHAPNSIDDKLRCRGCDRVMRFAEFLPPKKEGVEGTCPHCGIHIIGWQAPPTEQDYEEMNEWLGGLVSND